MKFIIKSAKGSFGFKLTDEARKLIDIGFKIPEVSYTEGFGELAYTKTYYSLDEESAVEKEFNSVEELKDFSLSVGSGLILDFKQSPPEITIYNYYVE